MKENWAVGSNTVSEIEMCFFAALIDGLRLIDEKLVDRPTLEEHFKGNALIDYACAKGKQIVMLLYPTKEDVAEASKRVAWRPNSSFTTPLMESVEAGKEVEDVSRQQARNHTAQPGKKVLGRKPQRDWDAVDWEFRDAELARQLGCPASTVYYARLRLGRGPGRKGDGRAVTFRPKIIRKIFPCRWCGFDRPSRSKCPSCGKLSNSWSAARAENGYQEIAKERDLTHMDVLLAIERNLIHEINLLASFGLGEAFEKAIKSFKSALSDSSNFTEPNVK